MANNKNTKYISNIKDKAKFEQESKSNSSTKKTFPRANRMKKKTKKNFISILLIC